jgi:hypothetical protein
MIPYGFVQALVYYAEQLDSIDDLEAWRDELYDKIRNGDGKTLINSSVNGKSFGWDVASSLTVQDTFYAVVNAIQEFNGKITTTYADFSGLQR